MSSRNTGEKQGKAGSRVMVLRKDRSFKMGVVLLV